MVKLASCEGDPGVHSTRLQTTTTTTTTNNTTNYY